MSVAPQSPIAALTNSRSFDKADVAFDVVPVTSLDDAYAVAARVARGRPPA